MSDQVIPRQSIEPGEIRQEDHSSAFLLVAGLLIPRDVYALITHPPILNVYRPATVPLVASARGNWLALTCQNMQNMLYGMHMFISFASACIGKEVGLLRTHPSINTEGDEAGDLRSRFRSAVPPDTLAC